MMWSNHYAQPMTHNRHQLVRLMLPMCCLGLMWSGCAQVDPLEAALPTLPPVGGAVVTAAGRLTTDNFDKERVPGPASQGLVGDFFMRNDKVRLVVQAPGRAIGPCPFGGNLLDFDRVDSPAGDQIGEVSPFLQLGRTIAFDRGVVVLDGSAGGPAVLRFYGHDAKDDFINILGLGGVSAIVSSDLAADIDLKLRAAVTYVLMPGETQIRILYTFLNTTSSVIETTWGTLSDSGAVHAIWHPGRGYGELGFADVLSGKDPIPAPYGVLFGEGISYGIVPKFDDPAAGGAAVPIAGVLVEVYGVNGLFDAFGPDGQTLKLAKNGTASREVEVVLGRDVADVTAQALALRNVALQPFSGTASSGGGTQIAVFDPSKPAEQQLVTTVTSDATGAFSGRLPAGNYEFQAEGLSHQRSPRVPATVPSSSVTLTVPVAAALSYTVHDRAGASLPAKIVVVGAPANPPSNAFHDTHAEALPYGVAGWLYSRYGDSARNNEYDHPLVLGPGRYRVVVSHGPEWSRFEKVIDLTTAGQQVDVVLDRVVPTTNYVAADFHQHSNMSPDSYAKPTDRVLSYLVDGVELLSSSDHDVLFDYTPVIEGLGASELLDSCVGVETTPFDYGHYIAFPIPVDPTMPNGGALDWGGGEMGLALPPPQIYAGLRKQGAEVVQVNHPRVLPGQFSDFQQGFDRVGLRFDYANRTFFGDKTLMPVSALILGLPEDAPLFDTNFDTHEIYNGFSPALVDGDWLDQKVDLNLHDYMNFLSFGFTPTPTGVSDSHGLYADPGGLPRTLVHVPDDSATAIKSGIVAGVVNTLLGRGVGRDVVVTNAPFVQLTAAGATPGQVATLPAATKIHVEVKVITAAWAPVDTVEVFANNTFDLPLPKGMAAQPIQPILCFTSKAVPSARCAAAVGGARPLATVSTETVVGVPESANLTVTVSADLDPADVASRTRSGARGTDLWLLARTFGSQSLFPVIPNVDTTVPISDLVEKGAPSSGSTPSLAFTSPVYIDVDGNGYRAPFQP